jgi:hypothetical protein
MGGLVAQPFRAAGAGNPEALRYRPDSPGLRDMC